MKQDPTSVSEAEYRVFLKTMLAECIMDQDDPIFKSESRKELEEECISFGMNLPLVRVVADVA